MRSLGTVAGVLLQFKHPLQEWKSHDHYVHAPCCRRGKLQLELLHHLQRLLLLQLMLHLHLHLQLQYIILVESLQDEITEVDSSLALF